MTILNGTIEHLLNNVLAAATEYQDAEIALSKAYSEGEWSSQAITAKRKASELAIAIDGLSDRAKGEISKTITEVRNAVSSLCFYPQSGNFRQQAFERVNSVANAYKHSTLTDPKQVINDFDDILVVGLGYGLDGFGVGKMGGVEVLVRDKSGKSWKFLGDVSVVLPAWFRFLKDSGAVIPVKTYKFWGTEVYP